MNVTDWHLLLGVLRNTACMASSAGQHGYARTAQMFVDRIDPLIWNNPYNQPDAPPGAECEEAEGACRCLSVLRERCLCHGHEEWRCSDCDTQFRPSAPEQRAEWKEQYAKK